MTTRKTAASPRSLGEAAPDPGPAAGEGAAGPGPALTITVYGTPVGQGRISYNRAGRGYHSNDKTLKPWRKAVAQAAADVTGQHPYTKPPKPRGQKDRKAKPCAVCGALPGDHGLLRGPVTVDIVLTFARPKTVRRAHPVTRSAGDWDHLGRAIGDALTGIVWPDDAQIIDGRVRKIYIGAPGALDQPGAVIRVSEVTDA